MECEGVSLIKQKSDRWKMIIPLGLYCATYLSLCQKKKKKKKKKENDAAQVLRKTKSEIWRLMFGI